MGILDGVSAGLTAATKGAAGAQQGQIAGSQLLRALQMQMLDADEKRSMIGMNNARGANFLSEKNARENPIPKKVYDPTRGVLVDEGAGSATPVAGLPDKPLTPHRSLASGYVDKKGAPVTMDEEGKFYGADGGQLQPTDLQHYNPPVKPEKEPAPQLITGVGADGKPTYGVFDKGSRTIKRVDASDMTPKVAGPAGGQNAPQMAASKANLDAARKVMDEYEEKLKSGKAHIGVLGASEGAVASSPDAMTAHGPMGALGSVLANAAASHLQQSDPELARYQTAKKYVAEAILNTHKRPNQTQYEIEQELSGAGAGANPMQIDMGRERRDRMYNEVFGGASPSAAPAAPHAPAAPVGNVDLRQPAPKMSNVDKIRAAKDPKFAAWLRAQGAQ